jgi:saccharopine dehydrogenase-like NADP-dependent oxidoreductase
MSRTTALTCAAVAELLAEGRLRATGVVPLERLGSDPAAYSALRRALARHGIRWRVR